MDSKAVEYHKEMAIPPHSADVAAVTNWAGITSDAAQATATEHKLTLWQGLKLYRKAAFWSMVISMTIIMEGYDTALIGNFYAYPSFKKKYGEIYRGTYQITSPWMNAMSFGTSVLNLVSVQVAGSLSQRYGYRPLLLSALVIMSGAIFIPFFAPNIAILLVGQIVCGIPWGMFAVLAPAYASEVCPVILRGYLTIYLNLCWIIGQLIAAGVVFGLVGRTDEWSYRIPFAVQWVWPIPLFCLIYMAPESPWWCVRNGDLAGAEIALKRLSQASDKLDTKKTVAMMVHTNEFEKEHETGTSIRDCFKGTDRRRTEIACVVYVIQTMTGAQIAGPYFFEQAGLSPRATFGMGLGGSGIGFLGTLASWVLIGLAGRRTIMIGGMAGMTAILLIVGFLALGPASNTNIPWAQGGLGMLWVLVYNISVGPLVFAIFSEVSSTRLRGKTIALAKNANTLSGLLVGIVSPYFINPINLNWKGKVGFFWGGVLFLFTVWAYLRLPELKGRTYEELDLLFAEKVKAKDFKKYEVDVYEQRSEKVGEV